MVLKNPVTELGLILSLFFLFVCGCNGFFFKSDLDDLELRAPKLEVEGSAGSLLGQHRSLPPQGFEEHLEKLLEEERFYSAQRFVEKYPELVLELLRRSTTLEATSSTLQFIAKVYDSNFVSTSEMGWYALLKDRISNPDAYSAFDQSHQKQLSLLERGYFKELAQADSLLSHVPPAGKMLQLEALYLKAIALFLDNQNDEAAQTFEKGVQLAQNYDPFQVALFSLFRSESFKTKKPRKNSRRIMDSGFK
jgi:hypothetical protein